MASYSKSERTPLIPRRQNHSQTMTNPSVVHDGTRRRGITKVSSSNNNTSSRTNESNELFSPSLQEFEKGQENHHGRRRKNWWENNKVTYLCQTPRQQQRRQYIQRMSDERYYEDTTNVFSSSCTFGTNEDDGIWINRTDQGGIVMAVTVWLLIVYSGMTVTLLATHGHLSSSISMVYCTICTLALASHSKCMFTDPGAIPQSAVPPEAVQKHVTVHAMCSMCESYKPSGTHHCRICNRCISHMDHHCPWMNNCIGAGNLKHFILFLVYTWTGAAFSLLVFGHNYFLCTSEDCAFSTVLVQLVRAMTLICVGALLFTSNMLMTVVYAVMTGLTTIDRLKRKAANTLLDSEDEPIDPEDIFGIQGYWTWPLPVDPVFEDFDRVMGYSTTDRLLREQRQKEEADPKGFSEV